MAHELFFDLDAVEANVARAETEDLLDRATVYRNGMEPEALNLIDAELRARGIGDADLMARLRRTAGRGLVYGSGRPGGEVRKVCASGRGAEMGLAPPLARGMPVFPRPFAFCEILPAGGVVGSQPALRGKMRCRGRRLG